MRNLVRLGDPSDHGGKMITANGLFKVNGKMQCVNGDLHSCPVRGHGVTPVSSSYSATSNGKSITLIGDKAGCGATIVSGSSDTWQGD